MHAIRLFAAAMVGGMIAAIFGAASTASFTDDGAALLALAWGRVTLVDLYLAFGMAWAWIAYRERSPWRAGAWLVATLLTGSLALGIYLLGAALRAATPTELLLGPHRTDPAAATTGSTGRR